MAFRVAGISTTLSILSLAVLLTTIDACSRRAAASGLSRDVDAWRGSHETEIIGELDALTRLPSVAANPQGIRVAANRLTDQFRQRGFQTTQFTARSGSPPLVFGTYKVRGARHTVVFYAHYDGQPVTPSQWSSDPFVPVMRSGPLGAQSGSDGGWADRIHARQQWTHPYPGLLR